MNTLCDAWYNMSAITCFSEGTFILKSKKCKFYIIAFSLVIFIAVTIILTETHFNLCNSIEMLRII